MGKDDDTSRQRDDERASEGESADFDALRAAEELAASMAEGEAAERGRGGANDYVQMLEGEVAALQEDLAKARARAERAEGRAASATDEIEKSRARIEREAEKEQSRQLEGTLRKFLEVLDDLDRAIASARTMDHNPEVLSGVELVRKRFLTALAEFGVRHQPAEGMRFDPELHDAVSAVPVADPAQDGIVVGVVSEGYAIGDGVLRPARVAVGKAS